MRSAYTAGVLDFFLDKGIDFPVVATASSGALIGSSYIAKQRNRNYRILKELGNNPESVSIMNWIRKREIFNMDYIFDKIPREIVPLDFGAFSKSPSQFIVGTTDIDTGSPVYYHRFDTLEELLTITRASCSLPVLAPSIIHDKKELMDGGVSNPLPILPLIQHGLNKQVVVLTRNRGYMKKATKLNWFFKHFFKEKPELRRLLRDRHILYNKTMELLYEKERKNEVFLIQPEEPLIATRIENNKEKLEKLYSQGYQEAEVKHPELERFIQSTNNTSPYATGNIPS